LSRIFILCRGSRTLDPRNTSIAPPALQIITSLINDANIRICGSYLHVTLVIFTTLQMNEIEPTRSNPAVPKNSKHGNRYDYVAKTPRDVELENDIV